MAEETSLSAEQQAFVNKFPEPVRPLVVGHAQTPVGREDIQAFIDAGTEIDVPKASAAKGSMQQGMGYDQQENKLIVPTATVANLNPDNKKDQALFSYMMSNEAAHAIQARGGSNEILEAASQRSIEEGTKFGLKMEMASDARSNLNLAERIKSGVVGVDDIPDIVSRKENTIMKNSESFTDAYREGGTPEEISSRATQVMWPAYGLRVATYRRDAIADAEDSRAAPSVDPCLAGASRIDSLIDKSAGVEGLSKSMDDISTRLSQRGNTPAKIDLSGVKEVSCAFLGQPVSPENEDLSKKSNLGNTSIHREPVEVDRPKSPPPQPHGGM
jgi:hypothetical protein